LARALFVLLVRIESVARKTIPKSKKVAADKSGQTVSRKKRASSRAGSERGATPAAKAGKSKSRSASKATGTKKTMAGRKPSTKSRAKKKSEGDSTSRKAREGGGRSGSRPTKGQAPAGGVEKAKPAAHQEDTEQEVQQPVRKSRLKPEELNMFREMLMAKRSQLSGTVQQLRDDALHKNRQESTGDLSSMPIHMADIGSDNWEQEFTLDLLANENELLREIDQALERIDNGTYGICLATNKPIQKRRLRAKPWAKYCIEYARELELRGGS
jgi:RNA polymerase-binding protein DksA